jgi:lysophospholipase L1-like esterase/pimeloyl-ACP methyl ester carboxylesterase
VRITSLPAVLFLSAIVTLTHAANARAQQPNAPQDVAFTSKLDQTEQRYVVVLPPDFQADRPHDLIIAFHGHGSDRWQFVKDERGECLGTRTAASEHNAIFVSPDYRAKTSWMGPAATADLLQMLDDLHGQYRIRNVIISGGSMGGTSAMAFAAMHPECVDGVVSLNGTANLLEYDQFTEAITESFGGTRADKPEIYRERSAELYAERLTMPFAATTGGKDKLVPPDSTLRLMAALQKQGSPNLSLHRPDGGHDTSFEDTQTAFRFVFEQLTAKEAAAPAPVLSSFEQPTTIVCLGDSVTGVYYHTGGHRAYPEMLELALKATHPNASIRVINAGISGHTTVEGLARLDADVLQHKPDVVTISFGLNDMVRVPADQYKRNLEELITRIQAQQSLVVLCTPNAVINTDSRPIPKLIEYCNILRTVGQERNVPVCDQFEVGERLRQRAPWTWRLTLSDAIHPNMDGHKRMAEELCRRISGKETNLDAIEPPQPVLARTQMLLSASMPVRVLAMEPLAASAEAAVRRLQPDAKVEVTAWPIAGKSLAQLEQEANATVRAMKPDLVLLTIPADAAAENDEQRVHSISWIMNWSLSFGHQEWDCVVVHPNVLTSTTESAAANAVLTRKLVHAQHLPLIDRPAADPSSAEELIFRWFDTQKK